MWDMPTPMSSSSSPCLKGAVLPRASTLACCHLFLTFFTVGGTCGMPRGLTHRDCAASPGSIMKRSIALLIVLAQEKWKQSAFYFPVTDEFITNKVLPFFWFCFGGGNTWVGGVLVLVLCWANTHFLPLAPSKLWFVWHFQNVFKHYWGDPNTFGPKQNHTDGSEH